MTTQNGEVRSIDLEVLVRTRARGRNVVTNVCGRTVRYIQQVTGSHGKVFEHIVRPASCCSLRFASESSSEVPHILKEEYRDFENAGPRPGSASMHATVA